MSISRVERLRDQSLRPWTLDVSSDESIAVECGKLEMTVKRSSPFKQGGDYAYLSKQESSNSDAYETVDQPQQTVPQKQKQNYSRFHQGQFDADVFEEAVQTCPALGINLSSQNDTTTSLLSNSVRFPQQLHKAKSLPFIAQNITASTPQQSNRIERQKSLTQIADHIDYGSKLYYKRASEGGYILPKDYESSNTTQLGQLISQNAALSHSSSRNSTARLLEENQRNTIANSSLKSSLVSIKNTTISNNDGYLNSKAFDSTNNQQILKHCGSSNENLLSRNTLGLTTISSGISTPNSVSKSLSHDSFSNIGDGSILNRRRIKGVKNLEEQKLTSSGCHSLNVNLDASADKREEVVNFAAVSRSMVSGNKSNSKIDSVWNLLSTPGYHEFVGSENIYKSEMNLAHTSTKDFQKSIINMDKTLNIKIDALSKWTEKAGENNIQIFTPGGTMKFN